MTTPLAAQVADLVQSARDRALSEPAWFFEHILGVTPLPWQTRATQAVLDVRRAPESRVVNVQGLPRVTIRSCHGTGKTQFLAMLAHLWNFTTYGLIACTAPKEAQLRHRLWPRYRKVLSTAQDWYKQGISVNNTSITLFGDDNWGMVAETASDPDNLAGYHDTPQLFLVDEASARRLDPMYPVIEGALTTPGSVVVEIGNPTRTDGEFWSHHCKRGVKDLYYRMHVQAKDAPQFISEDWINTMRLKYGEDSPVFKVRVLGEFAALDEYQLLPMDWVDELLDGEIVDDGSLPRLRVTLDVADGGADSSVCTACRHYDSGVRIEKQRQYYFPQGKAVIEAAKAAARMFDSMGGDPANGDDIVVDAVGVGAGAVSWLIEQGYPVVRYVGGAASTNTKKWRNARVQCYMTLYEYMSKGNIEAAPGAIDDEEEFRSDLTSIRRRVGDERIDDLEPKDWFRKNGLPSPDRADSLAMQFTAQSPWSASVADGVHVVGRSAMAGYDAGLT